jgi:hypothetical protein
MIFVINSYVFSVLVILSRLKSTAMLSYKIHGRLRGREESKSHSTCDKTKIQHSLSFFLSYLDVWATAFSLLSFPFFSSINTPREWRSTTKLLRNIWLTNCIVVFVRMSSITHLFTVYSYQHWISKTRQQLI